MYNDDWTQCIVDTLRAFVGMQVRVLLTNNNTTYPGKLCMMQDIFGYTVYGVQDGIIHSGIMFYGYNVLEIRQTISEYGLLILITISRVI